MDTQLDSILDHCRAILAPDGRVTCYDLDATTDGDGVRLQGIVLDATQRDRTEAAIQRGTGRQVDASDVRVLADDAVLATVTTPRAPVRGDPDEDGEQVTQVLYGSAVEAYDATDGWRRIRTPTGYFGWTRRDHLAERASVEPDAVVVEPRVPVEGPELPDEVYAGTPCRIESTDGEEAEVRFPTGVGATVPAADLRRQTETPTGEDVVETARQFLETPYEWGGMTVDGIDCSGLVWIAYRSWSIPVPRDSSQQQRVGVEVDREELQPGDLLFFPGHVAISLGGAEYVHASGSAEEVTINSLNPDDDHYQESLDEEFTTARRVL